MTFSIHCNLAQEHDPVCTLKIKSEDTKSTWKPVTDHLFFCRAVFQREATRGIKHYKRGPFEACLLPACSGLRFVFQSIEKL